MTTERPSSESGKLDKLEARVRDLRQSLARRRDRAMKKRKQYLVAGAVLTLLCFFSLMSLTSMVSKLDAHALTQIGRLEFEKHLPSNRASLASYLSAEAPTVVKHTLRSLLGDLLPELRSVLVRNLDERLTRILRDGEALLNSQMHEAIKVSKINLERHYPDLSDAERLDRIVSLVAKTFSRKIDTLLQALYPQYVVEIELVHDFVNGLGTSDDKLLTSKERTQKELIRTLLRLIAMEQAEGTQ